LRLRGDALPLVDLAKTLELSPSARRSYKERLRRHLARGGVRFGLLVETIADVQEVVIEPVVGALARIRVFSGQTILGDGTAVLILDPAAIVERAGIENIADGRAAQASTSYRPEREKTCIVLLRAGAGGSRRCLCPWSCASKKSTLRISPALEMRS